MIARLSSLIVEDAVARALKEDFGDAGDITTNATIPAEATAKAVIVARKSGTVAGVDAAIAAFRIADPAINLSIENDERQHDFNVCYELTTPCLLSANPIYL
jgi:nicotinate-nucleotide pyrophosphorylase (carboxylating)